MTVANASCEPPHAFGAVPRRLRPAAHVDARHVRREGVGAVDAGRAADVDVDADDVSGRSGYDGELSDERDFEHAALVSRTENRQAGCRETLGNQRGDVVVACDVE